MPDPPFDTRQESMKFVGASSFEGDPICFGPNETRPRPGGSPLRYASDSDDSGKAVVEGDTDVSGVTGKELMNVASSSSSSSSSSTVAETQDMCNNLASDSSSQHDEAEDTTDVPEAEDTTDVPEAEDTTDVPEAEDTTDVPEAEDTTDVPEALPMSRRSLAITPMNESDAHLYWRNQEPRLFEDTPEQADISSGLGYYEIMRLMELPEEPQHDADLHQVQEPEDLLMPSTPIVTFQVPGFSMSLAGGIVPFAEEQSVEDPDEVGLENLNIFVNPWRAH